MIAYNIYYKNEKVNIKPLSEEQIIEISKKQYVYKKTKFDTIDEIPVKKLKIMKCTII